MFSAPEWMTEGVCAQVDPDLWFPTRGSGHDSREAIKICQGCPIRRKCLQYALDTGELGIWGGTTAEHRRVMRAAS